MHAYKIDTQVYYYVFSLEWTTLIKNLSGSLALEPKTEYYNQQFKPCLFQSTSSFIIAFVDKIRKSRYCNNLSSVAYLKGL